MPVACHDEGGTSGVCPVSAGQVQSGAPRPGHARPVAPAQNVEHVVPNAGVIEVVLRGEPSQRRELVTGRSRPRPSAQRRPPGWVDRTGSKAVGATYRLGYDSE